MRIGIIGYGRIGKEFHKQALECGWEVPVILASPERRANDDGWFNFIKEQVDMVALCIPTNDDGNIAYNYMLRFMEESNKKVVTCEKGSLSNYYQELRLFLGTSIGYTATVGGGSKLLPWVKNEMISSQEIQEMHFIMNGTLNFIFDRIGKGALLKEAVKMAKDFGFAEPGAKNPIDIINKEASEDIPKKVAILANTCGLGSIRARFIVPEEISKKDLNKLVRLEGLNPIRFVVSFTKEKKLENRLAGGFQFSTEDWFVSAGFKNCWNLPDLILPDVNNAALICGPNWVHSIVGPGAGAEPTVKVMIQDVKKMCGI